MWVMNSNWGLAGKEEGTRRPRTVMCVIVGVLRHWRRTSVPIEPVAPVRTTCIIGSGGVVAQVEDRRLRDGFEIHLFCIV